MNWVLAHLVGDFLLQNDWMASGKKRSSWICLIHVLTYLIPFLFVANPPKEFEHCGTGFMGILILHLHWWQFALIGLQHFVQDRTNFVVWLMKAKGSGEFVGPPCGPWSVILTDNILHILFVAWVVSL
jgi:hypothetical protein